MQTLSIGPIVRFAWDTFKKRPWFFVGAFLFINILSNMSFQVEDLGLGEITPGMVAWLSVVGAALIIVNIVAKMGANAFLLKAHDAPESVVFKDLWAPKPFWRFVGATILKGLVVGLPLLLVVGAGAVMGEDALAILIPLGAVSMLWLIYASVRLIFAELIVMEDRLMPVAALTESARLTAGSFWRLVLLMLALFGVMILGLLALLVGILVALPVTMFAYAHTYRAMQSMRRTNA